MQLKNSTLKKIRIWVGYETWYKGNVEDMNRFYDFVNEYSKNEDLYIGDKKSLMKIIADEAKIPNEDRKIPIKLEEGEEYNLYTILDMKISLMVDILEFLKRTSR